MSQWTFSEEDHYASQEGEVAMSLVINTGEGQSIMVSIRMSITSQRSAYISYVKISDENK